MRVEATRSRVRDWDHVGCVTISRPRWPRDAATVNLDLDLRLNASARDLPL